MMMACESGIGRWLRTKWRGDDRKLGKCTGYMRRTDRRRGRVESRSAPQGTGVVEKRRGSSRVHNKVQYTKKVRKVGWYNQQGIPPKAYKLRRARVHEIQAVGW
jgi:hypothetical protein